MLRFTAAGAVSAPDTLQVRTTPRNAGAILAGAPVPSARLDAAALASNLRYFTEERGPRERAVTGLVLSGDGLLDDAAMVRVVAGAAALGVTRVTRHVVAGEGERLRRSALLPLLTSVAVPLTSELAWADLAVLLGGKQHVAASLLLDASTIGRLDALIQRIIRLRPDRVVLTWPLFGEPPPLAAVAAQAARQALQQLDAAGIHSGVKGLAACHLGRADRLWRSANRWYVDADHQRASALLFFPDVVRYHKADVCRFCPADADCEGVPVRWWREGRAGALTPLAQG